MSKAPSPLLGYNNNVRHKNKVFHIQTEDSGVKYGHIITHLFMDGGRILKSVKTSYSEYLGDARMGTVVREMMKQQHKAMFIALRDGKFDHVIDGGADVSLQTKALVVESAAAKLAEVARERTPTPPPAAVAAPDATQPVAALPGSIPTPPPLVGVAAPVAVAPPAEPRSISQPPVQARAVPSERPAPRRSVPAGARGEDDDAPAPQTERTPPEELTLDIEALERAAAAAENASAAFRPSSDLPPPPTNLFREKTATGKYRTVSTEPPPPVAPPAVPTVPDMIETVGRAAASSGRTPIAPRVGPPPLPPEASRGYAATRPASIFGQARPQQGKSIFGEDLISDKSLDEVILSYLADDLEPPSEKKK